MPMATSNSIKVKPNSVFSFSNASTATGDRQAGNHPFPDSGISDGATAKASLIQYSLPRAP